MKNFEDLKGATLLNVVNIENEELVFTLENGDQYKLYHSQNCCESVSIDDINGELEDLIGTPVLVAEESTSDQNPEGIDMSQYYQESFTWTFYRLATIKGWVIIRWYGSSNGYYSESVDWCKV